MENENFHVVNNPYMNQYEFNDNYLNWYRSYGLYNTFTPAWLASQQAYTGVSEAYTPQSPNSSNGTNGNLNNTQLSGISVVANGSTTAIADTEVIPFNVLRNGAGVNGIDLLFDPIKHTITIQAKGNYFISWGADIDGITAVGNFLELTLLQSYRTAKPITYVSSSNSLHAQIVGNTVITVVNTPTVLSLTNTSGYAIDLAQVKVQAWMNVIAFSRM